MAEALWLIGLGKMGREFACAFKELGVSFVAIGNSEKSASGFEKRFGVPAYRGGVEAFMSSGPAPLEHAVIATPTELLVQAAKRAIAAGARRILLEKPGGLSVAELRELAALAQTKGTTVLLGYNRRFYHATSRAREIIREDGGPRSVRFEFSEWVNGVEVSALHPDVLRSWVLANSSHVIDLAFFLCGKPRHLTAYSAGQGELEWHPSGTLFSGAGVTESGCCFSYLSDWHGVGRWGIEVLTRKHRLILSPLESLRVMTSDTIRTLQSELLVQDAGKLKPGILDEVRAFLAGHDQDFCSLSEQIEMMRIYETIAAGGSFAPHAPVFPEGITTNTGLKV